MSKKRIIILGGSGFLGKALVEKLTRLNHEIITVNRGSTPTYHNAQVTNIIADRYHRDAYNNVLRKLSADIIYDCCAYEDFHTSDMIDIFKGKIEKFIHFSSASVYDMPAASPLLETSQRVSNKDNLYAYGKTACEKVLEQYDQKEFNWFSIRIPAIYGASDHTSREYAFYHAIISDQTILLTENKDYLLQNIHIDDVSDLCIVLLDTQQSGAQHFNISGSTFSLHQYLIIFAQILNKHLKIKSVSFNDPIIDQYNFDTYPYFVTGSNLILDCSKAKKILNFEPKTTLLKGLKKTIELISDHSNTQHKHLWHIPTIR